MTDFYRRAAATTVALVKARTRLLPSLSYVRISGSRGERRELGGKDTGHVVESKSRRVI